MLVKITLLRRYRSIGTKDWMLIFKSAPLAWRRQVQQEKFGTHYLDSDKKKAGDEYKDYAAPAAS